jgi:hypothetical protein
VEGYWGSVGVCSFLPAYFLRQINEVLQWTTQTVGACRERRRSKVRNKMKKRAVQGRAGQGRAGQGSNACSTLSRAVHNMLPRKRIRKKGIRKTNYATG